MPSDRVDSWKHSPPASAKEGAAADLLKQVGDAETLSPQALHRIERRLRSTPPRPFWLGNLALATGAVGALAIALVIVLTVRRFPDRGRASAAGTLADRTLALNDRPPPMPPEVEAEPSAAPAEREPTFAAAKKAMRPTAEKAEFAAAQPRMLKTTERARGPADGVAEAEADAVPAGQFQPAPSVASGAGRSLASGASAAPDRARFASAPPVLSAPAIAGLDKQSPNDTAACRASLPGLSATLARGTGDLEQALFGRGSCRLLLGQREEGLGDLRDYLARFPNGRFVDRARALLNGAGEY